MRVVMKWLDLSFRTQSNPFNRRLVRDNYEDIDGNRLKSETDSEYVCFKSNDKFVNDAV